MKLELLRAQYCQLNFSLSAKQEISWNSFKIQTAANSMSGQRGRLVKRQLFLLDNSRGVMAKLLKSQEI